MFDDEIKKWLSIPEYGLEWQDADLMLDDLRYLPMLTQYLGDAAAPEVKKYEVVMAFLNLLEDYNTAASPAENPTETIKSVLIQNRGVAERAMPHLGPIPEVMIRRILGLPMPSDMDRWVIDQGDMLLRRPDPFKNP